MYTKTARIPSPSPVVGPWGGLLVLALGALTTTPAAAEAQQVPTVGAPPEGCTYVRCALRLDHGRVVAGLEGREVSSFGWFDEPELMPLISVSDSASHYYGLAEREYPAGSYLTFVGTTVGLIGWVVLEAKQEPLAQRIGVGLLGGGVGLHVLGRVKQGRARDALRRSLHFYNRELPDLPTTARESVGPPPELFRQDHRRAGTVVGTVAGLAAGLALSSDLDSVVGALGVTSIVGMAGGLVGRGVGAAITR